MFHVCHVSHLQSSTSRDTMVCGKAKIDLPTLLSSHGSTVISSGEEGAEV